MSPLARILRDADPLMWLWLALNAMLFLPELLAKGMFSDGLIYASISRNLAEGIGSWWSPQYTESLYAEFMEHPPIFFWVESIFFRLFGDHFFIERLFSLAAFCFLVAVFYLIHRKSGLPHVFAGLILMTATSALHWVYQNNMMEMLIVPCVLIAFHFSNCDRPSLTQRVFVLAACGAIVFMIKGPVALGVFALPLVWLPRDPDRWRGAMISGSMSFVLAATALTVLFSLNDSASHLIEHWFDAQVMGVLKGERASEFADSRWHVVLDLIQQSLLPLALCFLTWVFFRRKLRIAFRSPYFWTVLLFCLPYILTKKQHFYYIAPAIPFLALWLVEVFEAPFDAMRQKLFRIRKLTVGFSIVVIVLALSLMVSNFGNYTKHATMQRDLAVIEQAVVPEVKVHLGYEVQNNWSLIAYAMRAHQRTLHLPEPRSSWVVSTAPPSDRYERAELATSEYHLYKRLE